MNPRIDKHIPIPKVGTKRGTGFWQNLLNRMFVGDSFECSYGKYPAIKKASSSVGVKITARKLDKQIDGLAGMRVWRVE